MQSHVLYHESVSVSSWFMSETIVDIIQNTQVRLTERILKIIRQSHPHMESLLFSGGELRSSITELDIDRSFTVVDVRVNPWELKDSSSMEVDESNFKRGKKSSSSSAGSAGAHDQLRKAHLWLSQVMSLNLVWSQSSTSSSSQHSVGQLGQRENSQSSSTEKLSSGHLVRQMAVSVADQVTPQQGSVSRYQVSTSLPCTASLAQDKRGCLSSYSESSSCCLISCHCHVSHAQTHADLKGPIPDPQSDLIILFSGSGHVHILWAFRHPFRQKKPVFTVEEGIVCSCLSVSLCLSLVFFSLPSCHYFCIFLVPCFCFFLCFSVFLLLFHERNNIKIFNCKVFLHHFLGLLSCFF